MQFLRRPPSGFDGFAAFGASPDLFAVLERLVRHPGGGHALVAHQHDVAPGYRCFTFQDPALPVFGVRTGVAFDDIDLFDKNAVLRALSTLPILPCPCQRTFTLSFFWMVHFSNFIRASPTGVCNCPAFHSTLPLNDFHEPLGAKLRATGPKMRVRMGSWPG
jgi:hypothetical protein